MTLCKITVCTRVLSVRELRVVSWYAVRFDEETGIPILEG